MNNNDNFNDLIAKITAILGLIVLLLSVATTIPILARDEQGVRTLLVVAFLFFLMSTLWLAFGAKSVNQTYRWISLLALYVITIIFSILIGTWIHPLSQSNITFTTPNNLIQSFGFEERPDQSLISMDICNNSATTAWYENCYEASQKIEWVEGGYNSSHSIESQIELLPDKQQVYSFHWQLDKPLIAQVITAKIYIPEQYTVYLINMAALTKDGADWKVSGFYVNRPGWIQVLLDMQQFVEQDGSFASESVITGLHIDLFLQQASQKVKISKVKIDDIDFFYPSSKIYANP